MFRIRLVGVTGQKYPLLIRSHVLLSSFFRKSLDWADVVYVPRFWYSVIPVAKAHGKPVVTHLHDYVPICSLATRYDLSRNENCMSHNQCRPSCVIAHENSFGRSVRRKYASALLNFGIWPYVGRLILLSDVIVCVSKAQREILAAQMPSLSQKCRVIYNPLPEVSDTPLGGKDLAYFGGPGPLKGYNVLTQATTRAKADDFNSRNGVRAQNVHSISKRITYVPLPLVTSTRI